jgi:hypothetical protein
MSAKFDRYIEFTDVHIALQGAEFSAACAAFGTEARGWWSIYGGYVFTAAASL